MTRIRMNYPGDGFGIGAVSSAIYGARVDPLAHYMGPGNAWDLKAMKGVLGEELLVRSVTSRLLEAGRMEWTSLSPHRAGNRGIDALFLRTNREGRATSLMVADAKFGSARLATTLSGKQMGAPWVRGRLPVTVEQYRAAADAVLEREFAWGHVSIDPGLAVPLPNYRRATVWVTKRGVYVEGPRVDRETLVRQLRRTAEYVDDVAKGLRPFRARLLEFKPHGDEHVIVFRAVNERGDPIGSPHTVRGRWQDLRSNNRMIIRASIRRALDQSGLPEADLERVTTRACEDPRFLRQLRLAPTSRWAVGAAPGELATSAGRAIAIAAAAQFLAAYRNGEIDWGRTGRILLLAGGIAALGQYTAAQIQFRLASSPLARQLGRALPLRDVGGSVVAGYAGVATGLGIAFVGALGAWAFGLADAREAQVIGVASAVGVLASAAVPAGAFALAGAVGTAGTGTAIGTLSGAAANSATLAWVGGTVAAGSAILTGGAIIAGVAATRAFQMAIAAMDRIERRRLIEGRLEAVRAHLRPGAAVA